MTPRRLGLAIAIALAACARTPPEVASCADSLAGVWRGPAGEWSVLDSGASLEVYPLFADAQPAPRVIALQRSGDAVSGTVKRRHMLGDAACIATAPVHVVACSTRVLELTLADPAAPVRYTPCELSARTNPSRREKWQRVF